MTADSVSVSDGTFIAKQSITKGIDNAIDGLLGMLKGENFGKAVLTIAELDGQVSCSRRIHIKVSASDIRSETPTGFLTH